MFPAVRHGVLQSLFDQPVKMTDDLLKFYTEAANKQRLLQMFWLIGQVRYITFSQFKSVKKPWSQHIATKKRLALLSEMGYLNLNGQIYTLTSKAIDFLNKNGYNTRILQKRLRGQGNDHDLKITDYLLSLQDDPEFFTVFYPIFKTPPDYQERFLEPDACLIHRRPDGYKIVFLEVELEKDGWENHLLGKKAKYEQVAQDFNTYNNWWRFNSEKLGLPMCSLENFCFSILCLGGVKYEWEGWEIRS